MSMEEYDKPNIRRLSVTSKEDHWINHLLHKNRKISMEASFYPILMVRQLEANVRWLFKNMYSNLNSPESLKLSSKIKP